MTAKVNSWPASDTKGTDQAFLASIVYPAVAGSRVSHDSFYCTRFNGKPFPTRRPPGDRLHVGQTVYVDEPPYPIMDLQATPECRGQPDWIYG